MSDRPTIVLDEEDLTLVSPVPRSISTSSPNSRNRAEGFADRLGRHWRALAVSVVVVALLALVVTEHRRAQELRVALAVRELTAPPPLAAHLTPTSSATDGVTPSFDAGSADSGQIGSADEGVNRVPTVIEPRLAFESVVQNKLREALHQYRELAVLRPNDPVFRDVAEALEAKLARQNPSNRPSPSWGE